MIIKKIFYFKMVDEGGMFEIKYEHRLFVKIIEKYYVLYYFTNDYKGFNINNVKRFDNREDRKKYLYNNILCTKIKLDTLYDVEERKATTKEVRELKIKQLL